MNVMINFLLLFYLLLFLVNAPAVASDVNKSKDSSAYNTSLIEVDDLLLKIETVSSTLDSINKITKEGFDTREIEEGLPKITDNLLVINDNITLYSPVLNIKNLQMYEVLLEDVKEDLDGWRISLFKYNKELAQMRMAMGDFTRDSTARLITQDTVFRHLYANELGDIRKKWDDARHFTTANLIRITTLQASVSKVYFQTIELQQTVAEKLREYRRKSLSKEFSPLYLLAKTSDDGLSPDLVERSYEGQKDILSYYIKRNWYNQVFIILAYAAFFWWVFISFAKIKKENKKDLIKKDALKYTSAKPVLSSLVVALTIAPFFDLNPPSAYVDLLQFFLLIALTVLFARNWQRRPFLYWLVVVLLYVLFSITNAIITPEIGIRMCLFFLNILSVLFGLFFIRRLRKELAFPPFVKIILIVYIILNSLATLCNFFGRLSLAKVFSMAGIFGLTQIIGLSVVIQIITEGFYLQMIKNSAAAAEGSAANSIVVRNDIRKIITGIALLLWIVVFVTNLGIYTPLYSGIKDVLGATRKLGSISFTLGNILLFFIILYVSHLLQKGMGQLFGDGEEEYSGNKKGTRLVILRLVLLIVGFLLAVAASGLPIDRITIVLGALGVGIGLGLQNIVNNLVSGIILIFESPFRIGDSIEVNGRKGRVKDMGIRASKILTLDGSEIIVPNGDFLSSQVVNWSGNNNTVRSELLIKIEPESFAKVKEYILKVINSNTDVVKRIPPEVSINSISGNTAEIKVQFWINHIRREQELKSEILSGIYKALKENNIIIQ